MIKFFGKTRRQLIVENKPERAAGRFSKYLLYAVGEIVLVVIGILIALQVNNWNEERKYKKEGTQIEHELYTEFLDNRVVLKERIDALESANQSVRAVLSYMNKDQEIIQNVNMDSIITNSLKYGNYNPSNSTIQELIGSGRLNFVSNKQLKGNLYKWLQLLNDTDEDFKNQDQQATTLLMPYFTRHISIKNLNSFNNMDINDKSELFSGNYEEVFKDLELENLYQSKLYWNTVMVNHYKELDALALEILDQAKQKE
jgi:hypothetical protein